MEPKSGHPGLVIARSTNTGDYLEVFLVLAICTVLLIRIFLELTGYPQLGGEGLHIAHMLWGGLIMTMAIVMTLVLLGRNVKYVAAGLGGIGFGIFIDELGKFITSDNNYFFQPTIALIYVVFILLFLLFRAIEKRREMSSQELLANVVDMTVDLTLLGASPAEVSRVLYLLRKSGANGPYADAIRQAVLAAPQAEETAPSFLAGIAALPHRVYDRLIGWRWFHRAMDFVFVVHAAFSVLVGLALAFLTSSLEMHMEDAPSFVDAGVLLASVLSSIMVVMVLSACLPPAASPIIGSNARFSYPSSSYRSSCSIRTN